MHKYCKETSPPDTAIMKEYFRTTFYPLLNQAAFGSVYSVVDANVETHAMRLYKKVRYNCLFFNASE